MLNHIILIGRLVKDPELRYTQSGVPVGSFRLAVDRSFKNQQGEREADFIDIVVWRQLAETCANHLSKGRLVAVDGRLQIRSYDAQDGQKRRAAEVVANDVRFLDKPTQRSQGAAPSAGAARGGSNGYSAGQAAAGVEDLGTDVDFNDDDVPF